MKYLISIAMIIFCNLAMGQIFKSDKWCDVLLTEEVRRFANNNFPPPPYKQPIVYIQAVPLSPRFYATAEELEKNVYIINVNIIYLDKVVGLERTLIHELQHVIQFHSGRLKITQEGFIFDGECYEFSTPYGLRPWEVEAFMVTDIFCD